MGKLQEEPYVPGNDLYTTIDLDLQRAAEDIIGDRTGAAVALDPRTGEILAMVSKPSFDPNLFATRISVADWSGLLKDPRKPLTNRVIQNHFSPGSVFKVFMASAGLEAGTLDPLQRSTARVTRRSTATPSRVTRRTGTELSACTTRS